MEVVVETSPLRVLSDHLSDLALPMRDLILSESGLPRNLSRCEHLFPRVPRSVFKDQLTDGI